MDQGWVRYIKYSKDVSGLDWIYEVKEGWINLGRIYQVELGLVNPFLASLLPVFPYVCGTSGERCQKSWFLALGIVSGTFVGAMETPQHGNVSTRKCLKNWF